MRQPRAMIPAVDTNAARLYAIVAREARKAVVLRRGPARQVLLLTWDLKTDVLTPGQWLKGRIYERRCDLTPDGELLVYFAATHRPPMYSWTAVSRPPWLTALVLWKKGDCWGGGGLFESRSRLLLNHAPSTLVGRLRRAPGYPLPPGLEVEPLGDHPGRGEDSPILDMRENRDGWKLIEEGGPPTWSKGRILLNFDPPVISEKQLGRHRLWLRRLTHGLVERQGRPYVETAVVRDEAGEIVVDLGRTEWCDLDHNGDVLFAAGGRLLRLKLGTLHKDREPRLVADLNSMRFEPVAPPPEALVWKRPQGARKGG